MSSSMVTYTSISSDSDLPPWGFHLMDLDEFEAPQSPEQAPPSPDYVPGYVTDSDPEKDPEEDLEEDPADEGDDDDEEEESFEDDDDEEDEEEEDHLAPVDSTLPAIDSALIAEYASAPTPPSPLSPLSSLLPMIPSPPLLLPPLHTIPTYASAPLGYKAAMIPSPPLPLPSPPLLLPSIAHRTDILEAEMMPQKKVCFTAPTHRFEVRESSTAAATRQIGHTLACMVDYGFIDTLDASIRAFEGRVMTAVGEVNERVTDLATTQRQDAHELYVHDEDAQDDRALLRAQISLLTRERQYFCFMSLFYEREAVYVRQAWGHSEERSQAMKARVRTLEAQFGTLQTQTTRWSGRDRRQKMAPKKTTTPMTDATIKQLIAQGVADALAEYEATRNSGNGNDSHNLGSDRRTERATRECTYSDFLKCQPLNFKGTERARYSCLNILNTGNV
ncbi:hypothetical protein Tco_0228233 [Tanacetum coccineum]